MFLLLSFEHWFMDDNFENIQSLAHLNKRSHIFGMIHGFFNSFYFFLMLKKLRFFLKF